MSVLSELRNRLAEAKAPAEPCFPSPAKAPPMGPGWIHEINTTLPHDCAARRRRCPHHHAQRLRLERPLSADRRGGERHLFNVDTITDFTQFADRIHLNKVVFSEVKFASNHRMLVSDFSASLTNPGNAHIIYDESRGRLFYDADARGGELPVHFATVLKAGKPVDLNFADIHVI